MPDDHPLGPIRSRHAGRNREAWLLAAVLGAVFVFFCASMPQVALRAFPLFLAALAVILAVTTFFIPRFALLREEGLELHRWLRAPSAIPFSAITGVSWDFDIKTTVAGTAILGSELLLHREGSRPLRLNPAHYQDAETLFARIGRLCVYPGHTARLDRFARGEDVAFGKVSVSPERVRIGSKEWRWALIKEVELSPKMFIFHFTDDTWRVSVSLSKMPYAFTLVELLRRQRVRLAGIDGFKVVK